jgi:hypothetical protein
MPSASVSTSSLPPQRGGKSDNGGDRSTPNRKTERRREGKTDGERDRSPAHDRIHDGNSDCRGEKKLRAGGGETHIRHDAVSVIVTGQHEVTDRVPGTLKVIAADAVDRAAEQEVLDAQLYQTHEREDAKDEQGGQCDQRKHIKHLAASGDVD